MLGGVSVTGSRQHLTLAHELPAVLMLQSCLRVPECVLPSVRQERFITRDRLRAPELVLGGMLRRCRQEVDLTHEGGDGSPLVINLSRPSII